MEKGQLWQAQFFMEYVSPEASLKGCIMQSFSDTFLGHLHFPKVNPLFNGPHTLEVSLNYSLANALNFFIFSQSGKQGFMCGFLQGFIY